MLKKLGGYFHLPNDWTKNCQDVNSFKFWHTFSCFLTSFSTFFLAKPKGVLTKKNFITRKLEKVHRNSKLKFLDFLFNFSGVCVKMKLPWDFAAFIYVHRLNVRLSFQKIIAKNSIDIYYVIVVVMIFV